jgi:D-alanyl-D-alanine carboxypeptidase
MTALFGAILAVAMAMQPSAVEAATKKKQAQKTHVKAQTVAAGKHAAKKRGKKAPNAASLAALEARKSSILVDGRTGAVLYEDRADEPRYPASLTKMMTLYLTFDALKAGKLRLDQPVAVSAHAASQAPSSLQLQAGETIRVEDAILGTAIKSANDAAVVLAEAVGGSEEQFARMMTQRARQLGMTRTAFRNANGLPNPDQYTTARDLATLGIALYRDQRAYYHYFGYTEFTFRGRPVPGHNRITANYDGADGLKTGFIRASGFNLVSSAQRDGRRLVGVVLGGDSGALRDRQMAELLDRGFAGGDMMVAAAKPRGIVPALVTPAVAGDFGRSDEVAAAMQPVSLKLPAGSVSPALVQAIDSVPATTPRLRTVELRQPKAAAEPAPKAAKTAKPKGVKSAGVAIQVGAFSKKAQAQAQLAAATKIARKQTKGAAPAVVPDESGRLYRARLTGLSPADAKAACSALRRQNVSCSVLPAAS